MHPYVDATVMYHFLKMMYDYTFLFLKLDNNEKFKLQKKMYSMNYIKSLKFCWFA